jgi:hypothetical protein
MIALGLALLFAGCGQHFETRTGERTLQRAFSRAFKRNYAAAYRMTAGHPNRGLIRHADVRCHPRGPQPADESAPWPWFCRVRYYRRHHAGAGLATYGLRVDERGCFQALTGAFPDRRYERVLDRSAPNPLVYIRSCP